MYNELLECFPVFHPENPHHRRFGTIVTSATLLAVSYDYAPRLDKGM